MDQVNVLFKYILKDRKEKGSRISRNKSINSQPICASGLLAISDFHLNVRSTTLEPNNFVRLLF